MEKTHAVIPLWRIFTSFLKLGLTSFGGPAMIVHIRKMAVEEKQWMDEAAFGRGVAFSQVIPGASAMQVAAYVGLKARGYPGALAGFAGFGLPAFLIMLAFSVFYREAGADARVMSVFTGLQVIIVAVVANAAVTFGRSAITGWRYALAAIASMGLTLAKVHPIAIILLSAAAGALALHEGDGAPPPVNGEKHPGRNVSLAVIVAALIACLTALFFFNEDLFRLSFLMLRIDAFAFGGGYASLPIMYHEVVNVHSWIDRETFLNGIVLGQITPGPIVITATFIGYMMKGPAGALVATVSIFIPSFLMVIGLEPYFNRIRSLKYFNGAVHGILCSFAGLLAGIAISFALDIAWANPKIILVSLSVISLFLKIDLHWIVLSGIIFSIFFL